MSDHSPVGQAFSTLLDDWLEILTIKATFNSSFG